ncbi:hypothetical protein Bca4012_009936 [Brassica carinata]|uniref:V-type proton ATPase subunit C n=1 Tax=Brassica carinata TaxID=52824 RepID=A0A8X8BDS2_BRACI|nr:hypothetical protein Bca52824_002330 [Brassica carinata]
MKRACVWVFKLGSVLEWPNSYQKASWILGFSRLPLPDSVIHGFIVVYYAFSFCIDDLLRFVHSNSFVEGVSQKIRRQIKELERISGVESNVLSLLLLMEFLMILISQGGRGLVDNIQSQVAKIEDDLKVRVSEYNNVRSQLNAINRKQILLETCYSFAVRDLPSLVKPEDIVASEHLETLLAVVPRSSKKLFEDNEYALYTVTHFTQASVISSRAFLEGKSDAVRACNEIDDRGIASAVSGSHKMDLATGFLAVLGNEEASREIFNISGEKYVTFDGLARACAKAGGFPEPEIVHYNPKEFDFGKKKAFPFLDQWAIEYEGTAGEAFRKNHPETTVIVDNCNVILGAIINGEMWRSR